VYIENAVSQGLVDGHRKSVFIATLEMCENISLIERPAQKLMRGTQECFQTGYL
jgi:hypothetical protein